ncbi:target of Nesh-SH3 isoform X9 [Ornithorhynchus anatinus]|uniref:target of Nesh-SH3 isoform X9 n=1 Tax=Ornithorhynchus anatinus TaxID=9258 RepID=UPI0010A90459|nr:target of Nesh-SH3 isoform X9 [Ornithorhynchus anatinus]
MLVTMISSLAFLLFCGNIALTLGNAQTLPKGKTQTLRVHINTTSDSILMKFLRPSPNTKLEGFVLGYGSSSYPNQYIPLPAEGKSSEAEVEAEPKYLIVVRPAPTSSRRKTCSGKSRHRKPLQLVVGTLSPSSVFLSWGFLINPQHDWTLTSHCPNDRFYIVRYREKDKEKKWIFQLCPATETVVENLKPNTIYEFGVKDNMEGGIWSKIFNHKTVLGTKSKGNGKIQSTFSQIHTAPPYIAKKLIPITVIKQVIQNVTHRASSKSPDRTSLGGAILVHLIVPGLNETNLKLPSSIMLDISQAVKSQLANESLALPAESKTPEVEKIPAQTVTTETIPGPAGSDVPEIREAAPTPSESSLEISQPLLTPKAEFPLSTLDPNSIPEFPQVKTSPPPEKPKGTLASDEMPWITTTPKMSEPPKYLHPKSALPDLTYVTSSPPPSEIAEGTEAEPATSESILKSAPPNASGALERPRATLASKATPFVLHKLRTSASPEIQQTTSAPRPTTSIPTTLKPKRTHPKAPQRKPAEKPRVLETTTSKISQSPRLPGTTLAPSTTQFISSKPKISLSPEVSQPNTALSSTTSESAPKPKATSIDFEGPHTTSGPSETEYFTPKPKPLTTPKIPLTKTVPKETPPVLPKPEPSLSSEVPQITPALGPEREGTATSVTIASKMTKRPRHPRPHLQPRPKLKTTRSPEATKTKPGLEPITYKAESSKAKIAPKSTKRPRLHPKPKTTATPEASQIKPVHKPVPLRTEAPTITIAPKPAKSSPHPRPKPTSASSPEALKTKPVSKSAIIQTEVAVTTIVAERVTVRTEPPATTIALKTIKPRHKRPKTTKMTPIPGVALTTPVPAVVFEPSTLRPETPVTTLAPKATKRTHPPRPKPKTTPSPGVPHAKPAFVEENSILPGSTTSPSPEMPKTKHVILQHISTEVELPKAEIAPKPLKPKRPFPPKRKTTPSPDASLSRPVSGVALEPISFSPESPKTMLVLEPTGSVTEPTTTTIAPKKTPRVPPKSKTPPSSVTPQTKPAQKVIKIEPSRTTTMAPEEKRVPSQPKSDLRPDVPHITNVPKDVHIPYKPRPDVSQTKPAPVGTRVIPPRPQTSSQDMFSTTQAEATQSTREPVTTKTPRTLARTKSTQAPRKTHLPPGRPRLPDKPQIRPGDKQPGPVDFGKPSSASRNTSLDSSDPEKKLALPPGNHRPPLPPARPTPPRRRPLPPNNMTGKPGSTGVILPPRVTSAPVKMDIKSTGASAPEEIETQKRQPTASASNAEFGNSTDSSSSPTSQTDFQGKQRFTAPHVRYIPKPEDVPCSITDTLSRFPKEEGPKENATSPPQNSPTNLTVFTVEGCSSFVILDWEKAQNDTVTEYEVISKENGSPAGKGKTIQTTDQTHSTVENLKPNTSYEFQVKPINPLGEGPASNTVAFSTESADPRVSEQISVGKDAIWTEIPFNSDSFSECKGKQYVKRTWYKKFVGVQLCNSLRYKIYLSDSLTGKFYNIGDQRGHGEDHCQFVDSFLDGRTGQQLTPDQLPIKEGYFRAVRQEPVQFGEIGGQTHINYVQWYECGTTIPGKW